MKIKRICNDCPCLNHDYENGSDCNLNFNIRLEWVRKSDMPVPTESVDEKTAWKDSAHNANINHTMVYASDDCDLDMILLKDGTTFQDRGNKRIEKLKTK